MIKLGLSKHTIFSLYSILIFITSFYEGWLFLSSGFFESAEENNFEQIIISTILLNVIDIFIGGILAWFSQRNMIMIWLFIFYCLTRISDLILGVYYVMEIGTIMHDSYWIKIVFFLSGWILLLIVTLQIKNNRKNKEGGTH